MVNRKVTSPGDPLIRIEVLIPRSAKSYLDTLEVSASRTIRELIEIHRQLPHAKKESIEKIKNIKITLATEEANLKRIEEIEKLDASTKTDFERKKADALRILVDLFTKYRGDFSKFEEPLQKWKTVLQIQSEELRMLVIEAAKAGSTK
ncbi:MAG: hypothetical protein WC556_09925 [Candidatus Methanoperedens sp.]